MPIPELAEREETQVLHLWKCWDPDQTVPWATFSGWPCWRWWLDWMVSGGLFNCSVTLFAIEQAKDFTEQAKDFTQSKLKLDFSLDCLSSMYLDKQDISFFNYPTSYGENLTFANYSASLVPHTHIQTPASLTRPIGLACISTALPQLQLLQSSSHSWLGAGLQD